MQVEASTSPPLPEVAPRAPRARLRDLMARERWLQVARAIASRGSLELAGGEPGNEIQSPTAVVMLEGLLSTAVLNTLVVSARCWSYGVEKMRTVPAALQPNLAVSR